MPIIMHMQEEGGRNRHAYTDKFLDCNILLAALGHLRMNDVCLFVCKLEILIEVCV